MNLRMNLISRFIALSVAVHAAVLLTYRGQEYNPGESGQPVHLSLVESAGDIQDGHSGHNNESRPAQAEAMAEPVRQSRNPSTTTPDSRPVQTQQASLPAALEVTRLNLNDGCVEGMHHRELPIFSIQCHPEASPGPHDSKHLFGSFAELMRARAA